MGILFSTEESNCDNGLESLNQHSKNENNDQTSDDFYELKIKSLTDVEARQLLRSSLHVLKNLILTYHKYQFPPVLTFEDMKSFFSASGEIRQADLCAACWKIFGSSGCCYIQEALLAMILLSESQWTDRLSQIYDLFISVGTEEMYKEDIQLLLFAAPSSLGKVWREALPEHQVLALAEHLADLAVVKLEKELDEGIGRDEFVQWAAARFKDSKAVSSMESLMKIYGSAHA